MNQDYKLEASNPGECMMVIADDLMNNWLFRVGTEYFRICELEFYYNDGIDHDDPYIHGRVASKCSIWW